MKNVAVGRQGRGGLGFVITIYIHSFATRGPVAIREWPCGPVGPSILG